MHLARFRAFNESFRAHMERHGAWPRERYVATWFKKDYGGYTSNSFTAMKRGEHVLEKYALGFVTMLAQRAHTTDVRHSYRTLLRFLGKSEAFQMDASHVEAVVAMICGPSADKNPYSQPMTDYLVHGVRAIGDFNGEFAVDRYVRGFPDDDALMQAIGWMYVRVAQAAVMHAGDLPQTEAEVQAGEFMGIGKDAYFARAQQWLDHYPWTVTRAWHKSGSVGVSIVLPVTDAAYERVRSGEVPPYLLTPDDMTAPTLNLIIEAAAERPESLSEPHINTTKPLFLCIAFQLAALARCHTLKSPGVLRILTFAGTPQNRERSLATGFVPTGTRMARTGLEVLERRISVGGLPLDSLLDGPLLFSLGWIAPPAPKI